jgi:hypothetical protein
MHPYQHLLIAYLGLANIAEPGGIGRAVAAWTIAFTGFSFLTVSGRLRLPSRQPARMQAM